MAASSLKFDAASHRYTKDGVAVPNVTSALEPIIDYTGVPAETLERARQIGTAVHLATELHDREDLDETSVDAIVLPYLDAWRQFRLDTGFIPDAIEQRVFHPRHWYAGTLDRCGPHWEDGERVVLDIKTTATLMPSTGPQLAAYAEARNYRNADKVKRRYAVQLKPDGTYRLQGYKDAADFSVFLAALSLPLWMANAPRHHVLTCPTSSDVG